MPTIRTINPINPPAQSVVVSSSFPNRNYTTRRYLGSSNSVAFDLCEVHVVFCIGAFKRCLDCQPSIIQGVPVTTEPGISLVILPLVRILQRNFNRSTFIVWDMKKNVSVVCLILINGRIIKETPGSVASGTLCIYEDCQT